MISNFHGDYAFLSNFWPGGKDTLEHKFQAAKTLDQEERLTILSAATPGRAKKLGQKCKLRPNWEKIKISVMRDLLKEKFQDPDLRQWLLETGDEELVEGNTWGDTFWGVCDGVGENHLGKLLMELRSSLR